MEIKKKVIWYCPNPTHYHKFLFNKIQESNLFEFEVIYFNESLQNYPWKDNFEINTKTSVLKKSFLNIDFSLLLKSIKKKEDFHIIAGWSEPTMFLLLTYFAIRKYNYIINTDTPRNREVNSIKQYLRKIWLDFMLSRVSSILVTGQVGVNIVNGWGIKNTSILNFPFTTDCDFFSPKPITKKHFIIFSSGRLDIDHKGYDTALQAIKKLIDNFPSLILEYRIAGTGPDYEKLQNLCSTLNLNQVVTFLGWKEIDELPELYNECNVFLHPSNFDPFPNAVLEAMSCGCVVVASNKAGSALERITHNVNGFLHQAGDYEDLYTILKQIIHLPEHSISNIKNKSRDTALDWSYKYNIDILKKVVYKI